MDPYNSEEKEQIREFKLAFEIFDKDKDGKISVSDLKGIMEYFNMNPSDEKLAMMKAECDLDNNQVIDFEEFVLFMNKRNFQSDVKNDLLHLFQKLDPENKGVIPEKYWTPILKLLKDPNNMPWDDENSYYKSESMKSKSSINDKTVYKPLTEGQIKSIIDPNSFKTEDGNYDYRKLIDKLMNIEKSLVYQDYEENL